jgi:hypothetical protein
MHTISCQTNPPMREKSFPEIHLPVSDVHGVGRWMNSPLLVLSGALVVVAAVLASLRVSWVVLTANKRVKQSGDFSQIIRKRNKLD